MYEFVDVIELPRNEELPAEALSINGVYIENEIPGYRTLQVLGRELNESEIMELETENRDGAIFLNKRNVQRKITVVYQMLSSTKEEFRKKFNELNRILNQSEATLVFADEPDMHFIGTKETVGEVTGGRLNVIGEFVLHCSNPYKCGKETLIKMENITKQVIKVEGYFATPCIIELTPLNDTISYTIKGAARNPITGSPEDITIKNLKQGKKVIIDGEACTVLQGVSNKFADTEMWEFPSLLPGNNTLTFSNALCEVTIKYKPRYF